MLKRLTRLPDRVKLIPDTSIQFLDFALDAKANQRTELFFADLKSGRKTDDGMREIPVHRLRKIDDDDYVYDDPETGRPTYPTDEPYRMTSEHALKVFDGQFLPVPFFRIDDEGSGFEFGPTAWCRARIVKLDEPDETGATHRVVLAFDTVMIDPSLAKDVGDAAERERLTCGAPRRGVDCGGNVFFHLAPENAPAARRFLRMDWTDATLSEAYDQGLAAARVSAITPRLFDRPEEPPQAFGEHLAAYLVWLDLIREGCKPPKVQLFDTYGDQSTPIDVNLMIDIGNSRTCGVFFEEHSGVDRMDLTQSYRLELRDLSRPEFAYSDPFESRVEFSQPEFGVAQSSRRMRLGASDAFWWPSSLRIGAEASALAAQLAGTEGESGLSAPKRYLWDDAPRPAAWVANSAGGKRPQPPRGPIISKLSGDGRYRKNVRSKGHGLLGKYSRSSMYLLTVCEVLLQALSQINSVSERYRRRMAETPRRLKRLILTLPTATPVSEQAKMRQLVGHAVDLVWTTLGWDESLAIHKKPKVVMDWDEATCTHLVYLFNEIDHVFKRPPSEVFDVVGEGRKNEAGDPALRVASIDIGGGTTDLMIIEHSVEHNHIVSPRQLFREGFRQAGDDLLKVVVEQEVLPALAAAMAAAGHRDPARLLTSLLSGDTVQLDETARRRRSQLVGQVLARAAIGLLHRYEETGGRLAVDDQKFTIDELIGDERRPPENAIAFFEELAEREGAREFKLLDVEVPLDVPRLSGRLLSQLRPMLQDLCQVIRAYGCDLVLLSGRPSRLPAIRDFLVSQIPTSPERIVSMGAYRVANWYPFRSDEETIHDPKTTAVVGAMLCQYCGSGANQFRFAAEKLKMKSTARFFGRLEESFISDANLYARDIDLDSPGEELSFKVPIVAKTYLGFRQLPYEDWIASPLYTLYIGRPEILEQRPMPITVTIRRASADSVDEDDQGQLESFEIADVVDAEGGALEPIEKLGGSGDVGLFRQTLITETSGEAGYWLDSGVLRVEAVRG